MMTKDASKVELLCKFGNIKLRLYLWLYNLCITYPDINSAIHSKNTKKILTMLVTTTLALKSCSAIKHLYILICSLTYSCTPSHMFTALVLHQFYLLRWNAF